jgi:fructosamine-3-kinase
MRSTNIHHIATEVPQNLRRDHEQVIAAVFPVLGISEGSFRSYELLVHQGRSSVCYLLQAGNQQSVVKIRGLGEQSEVSSGTRKEVELLAWVGQEIRTPQPLFYGIATSAESNTRYEYLVQEYLPFLPPHVVSMRQRLRLFTRISEWAAQINRVKVIGYGDRVDDTGSRFTDTSWRDFIDIQREKARLNDLRRAGLLTGPVSETIDAALRGLGQIATDSHLYHGDLLGNWANVLVNDRDQVQGILDWEYAGAGAATVFEIASVLYCFVRDGVPNGDCNQYLSAILDGYGISAGTYNVEYRPLVNATLLLHACKALNRIFPSRMECAEAHQRRIRLQFAKRARVLVEGLCRRDARRGI